MGANIKGCVPFINSVSLAFKHFLVESLRGGCNIVK